jgi:hypothetical protein
MLVSISYLFSKSAALAVYDIFGRFPFKTTINFLMATVYLFDFVFPSASPSVSFLFGFLVTEFIVDEITFIWVPLPLGSPSQCRRMKLALASCFTSSPLSQVLLFREELRRGVTLPPDHVAGSRTAIAIQTPPPLTFSMDDLALLPPPPRRSLFLWTTCLFVDFRSEAGS